MAMPITWFTGLGQYPNHALYKQNVTPEPGMQKAFDYPQRPHTVKKPGAQIWPRLQYVLQQLSKNCI